MSNAILQGGASGTGSVTLLAPNTNSTQTLTLPDNTGIVLSTATAGVPIGGPAFSVYQSSGQAIPATTATKLLFQVVEFDTNSNFAASRFTPTVAGYYQVNGFVNMSSQTTGAVNVIIYKNGSLYKNGPLGSGTSLGTSAGVSFVVFLNGSTDYIELFVFDSAAFTTNFNVFGTTLSASMVRSAT